MTNDLITEKLLDIVSEIRLDPANKYDWQFVEELQLVMDEARVADSQDSVTPTAVPNQADALSPYAALQMFTNGLTDKVRELDRLEREYRIMPGQSGEILASMIESFVWTVLKTLKRQEEGNDLANIDPDTILRLLESDLLSPSGKREDSKTPEIEGIKSEDGGE